MADTIITNARVTTLDHANPEGQAVAIRNGNIQSVGPADEIMRLANARTRVIDAGGRRVIPGLNDSHTHLIRGGLNYNMELRWEGVPSVADALRLLKDQAERTPAPQWVRVVGGWSEFQFAERRMPTLGEINAAAPELVDRGSFCGIGQPYLGGEGQIQYARASVETGAEGPWDMASSGGFAAAETSMIAEFSRKKEVADQNQLLCGGKGSQAGFGRCLYPRGLIGQPEL